MAAFVVVPKMHSGGRQTSYEIIDTDPSKPYRARLGFIDDEHQAQALVGLLNGAEQVYRKSLAALDAGEPFS